MLGWAFRAGTWWGSSSSRYHQSPLHIPVSSMYLEKEPLPSAKTKLGQVGKKLGSFLSWLPTPGTEDVPGFLTTRESDSESGADVSGVKCLSVHQHLAPGILPPWVGRALCSSHLPPLNSPKQVQGKRKGQASCCHPAPGSGSLPKWGGGEVNQGPTHPTLSHFLLPQDGKIEAVDQHFCLASPTGRGTWTDHVFQLECLFF